MSASQRCFTIFRSSHNSSSNCNAAVKTSLLDHLSSFILLLCFPLVPLITVVVHAALDVPIIMARTIVFSVMLTSVSLSVYARRPHLRSTLAREIRQLF